MSFLTLPFHLWVGLPLFLWSGLAILQLFFGSGLYISSARGRTGEAGLFSISLLFQQLPVRVAVSRLFCPLSDQYQ